MYTSYVNNYEKSLACLTSLTDNKKFQRFLRDTKSKGAAGGMDLMALLIMPIQVRVEGTGGTGREEEQSASE